MSSHSETVYPVSGQASVESLHGVAVRVGVAEKDFEGSLGFGHKLFHFTYQVWLLIGLPVHSS